METWLRVVLGAVALYSTGMVVAPGLADSLLFDPLGFGASDHGVDERAEGHLELVTAVTGAVLLGWSVLLLAISGRLSDDRALWRGVVVALAAWFVADTAMSLARDYPTHALFNLAFAVALGIPLLALRPR